MDAEMVSDDQTIYEYPAEFREQILALLLKPGWLSYYKSVVRPQYFPEDHEVSLAKAIIEYWEQYNSLPLKGDLLLALPEQEEYIDLICALSQYPLHKTQEEVIKWARENAVRLAFLESLDMFESRNYQGIISRFTDALRTGDSLQNEGYELVADAPDWIDLFSDISYLPTPWPHINTLVKGGLGRGELGVILAPSNGLKSTTLVNIGYHIANIIHRRSVLYISLEMSAHKILNRFAARALHRFYEPEEETKEAYIADLKRAATKMLAGRIKVIQYPTRSKTVADLKDTLKRQQDKGFDPDMIIVDYPDLLRPSYHQKEHRFELSEIYGDLRGWAIETNKVVWGATQSNRGSYYRELITMDDVAEDIGKVQICDIVLSVCRTKAETQTDKGRLLLAKVRDGRTLVQVNVKIRYPAIISTGIVEDNTDEEQ